MIIRTILRARLILLLMIAFKTYVCIGIQKEHASHRDCEIEINVLLNGVYALTFNDMM